MSKLALVTGACGFTGTHMVELLKEKGWNVIATDLKKEEHAQYYCEEGDLHPVHYEEYISRLGVEFVPADLTKKETLEIKVFTLQYFLLPYLKNVSSFLLIKEN